MSIIEYDKKSNTFSVYGQTFTADYFNHFQIPLLLDANWSLNLIHNALKDTPLANHRDHRLVNHRRELAEIAEREAKEAAERKRLALLRDPEHQAKLKRQREAFAAKSRAHAAALKSGRPVRSSYDVDPIPSIKW
ncbi:hypothetical protein GWZ55_15190 [Vibrio cholerae]|uniref:hypothetical protein n=1 Tax=Vibrio cholerae TaxID=666 RepID=UPI001560EF5A|nr:hypothetical protein [Vibrio cholerae]EGR1122901.1 hypothetical protein [Vibrio cholerae]ELH0869831.1 hypothetical protein [Vibrio cholerae]ELJ8384687.1 hypothetical protein [Vibrio cholerae]ELR6562934.1 hypothetical protein [Vibrio cholerae]NOF75150.1 hypothetical protein [Vibrio cholerae]